MVYRLTDIDNAMTERIGQLLDSLRSVPVTIDEAFLERLLSDDRFNLFVAEDDDRNVMGMLTLTSCPTLAGEKVWVEDVIVDEKFRGKGVGRVLLRAAIDFARNEMKAQAVYLTSNPSRVQARSLYRSEGFEEYETGVFRIKNLV